ncbi:MAG TPA: 2-hydroxyacyl-CoA dehydratase, partial [Kofleriaceae bacterium]|nr:2-hydroxyacyl-CoA dehydratase [Kofleriaceae bacterium]
ELYLMLRAGLVLPVETFDELLVAYRAAVEADAGRTPMDQARVMLVGSFCEQPPLGLIKTLELAGCHVVWDDMTLGSRWIETTVAETGDPLGALADAFLHHSVTTAARYQPDGKRGEKLVQLTRRTRAEGVIFAAPSFCDPALLDQPMLQVALDGAAVPWTAFKYAENLGQFQVIREQAGTFADSIKLWSEP